MGLLYLCVYLQLCLYYYFKLTRIINHPLLEAGYIIGMLGFWGGILGIQYIMIKSFASEMGALETLGYSRLQYGALFFLKFIITSSAAFALSFILFQILYATDYFQAIPVRDVMIMHGNIFWRLFLTFNGFTLIFILLESGKDPLLMLKTK